MRRRFNKSRVCLQKSCISHGHSAIALAVSSPASRSVARHKSMICQAYCWHALYYLVISLIYMHFHGINGEKYDHKILWIMLKWFMWKSYLHSGETSESQNPYNKSLTNERKKAMPYARIEDRERIFLFFFLI